MVLKCQAKCGVSDQIIPYWLSSEDTGFVIAPYQNIIPNSSEWDVNNTKSKQRPEILQCGHPVTGAIVGIISVFKYWRLISPIGTQATLLWQILRIQKHEFGVTYGDIIFK